jgi:hypothetical protein
MGKKIKLKSNRIANSINDDPTSHMMTEQEEKMFYSTKRHSQSGKSRHETPHRKSIQSENDMED